MIKVSIIVPVYNVYPYLRKCLDSLVNQTLKEIEIIIVNDGSLDNSQEIIDEYKKKYKNIKAYKKENGGLSSARNTGLKKARGEYIAFVDSDDYVELDMYEKMYKKALEKNFSVVVSDLTYIYPDKKVLASSNILKDIEKEEELKKAMINIYPAAWNKIFNHQLLKESKILFKEGVWFEDVEFLYRLFPYIKSIGVVKEPLYNYLQREGAITRTFDERLFNYITNFNGVLDFYKKNNLYDKYSLELEYAYVRYLYATFMKSALNYNDLDMINKAYNEATYNVKKNFPNYRKNKYFYKSLKGIYLLTFNKFYIKILTIIGGYK